MDLEKIEKLVEIFEKSSMQEFRMKEGDTKIYLSKLKKGGVMPQVVSMEEHSLPAEVEEKEEVEEDEFIVSPIVGTFYSAPSPDMPAFVRVGDTVKSGQPVCIVEAMKLMNEISCDYDCEIEAVLVSNEQKVEYGMPLFRVKRI